MSFHWAQWCWIRDPRCKFTVVYHDQCEGYPMVSINPILLNTPFLFASKMCQSPPKTMVSGAGHHIRLRGFMDWPSLKGFATVPTRSVVPQSRVKNGLYQGHLCWSDTTGTFGA